MPRSPSLRPVGVVSAGALTVMVCTSVPPSNSRTRTAGVAVLLSLASATTRSSASRPATSGTSLVNVCTLWVTLSPAIRRFSEDPAPDV